MEQVFLIKKVKAFSCPILEISTSYNHLYIGFAGEQMESTNLLDSII